MILYDGLNLCEKTALSVLERYKYPHEILAEHVMANHQPLDDRALIEKISAGDEDALVILYDRYAKPVFNIAYYVLQNHTLAEEITQDVFFLVWQYPQKWHPSKSKLGTWLYSVTRYMAIDRLRHEKSRTHQMPESFEELADRIAEKASGETPEDSSMLRSLLKRLPKEQRDVLLLTYLRGMTHIEISKRLQVPEGTIKSRLRLSLEKLREWWREAINENL